MKNKDFHSVMSMKDVIKELKEHTRKHHSQELELEGLREMVLGKINSRVQGMIDNILEQLSDKDLALLLHEVDIQVPEEKVKFVDEADLDGMH